MKQLHEMQVEQALEYIYHYMRDNISYDELDEFIERLDTLRFEMDEEFNDDDDDYINDQIKSEQELRHLCS